MTSGLPDVLSEKLIALGLVTEWSATLESTLRSAFCSLVGSKYAAIVAGGQGTAWLIEQCRALTDANLEIRADRKQAIMDALQLCHEANQRRNTLVHGVKSASRASDGFLQTSRSRRGSDEPQLEPWTPATIRQAATALARADGQLAGALQNAVSAQMMVVDYALAWERQRRGRSG
jgi:hypothetical protein